MEQWLAALFHVNRNWDEGILGEIFIPEVHGKKITNIFENQLREIRHKVAHGSLESGDFLLLDESEDRELVVKWLPSLRSAARRRMKNDFDTFLRYLGEDGSSLRIPTNSLWRSWQRRQRNQPRSRPGPATGDSR